MEKLDEDMILGSVWNRVSIQGEYEEYLYRREINFPL